MQGGVRCCSALLHLEITLYGHVCRELKHATEYTLAALSADLLQEHKPEVNSSDVAGTAELDTFRLQLY